MTISIRKYISFTQVGNDIHATFYRQHHEFEGLNKKSRCVFREARWEKILPKLIKQKPLNNKWLTDEFEEYIRPPEDDYSSICHLSISPELIPAGKISHDIII